MWLRAIGRIRFVYTRDIRVIGPSQPLDVVRDRERQTSCLGAIWTKETENIKKNPWSSALFEHSLYAFTFSDKERAGIRNAAFPSPSTADPLVGGSYKKRIVCYLSLCDEPKVHTIISQIITLLHVSTLSCHPQPSWNQYLAKLNQYLVLWTNKRTQIFHKLSHCYMFRHYRIILRQPEINTLPS